LGLLAALLDRPKRVVAANALYGATTNLLMSVFGPMGVETTLADVCDLAAFEEAVAETKPGAVIMETVSNPLLRVAALDKIAEICKRASAPLIVDNTFATPMLVRPLDLGASIVVHSATKYMAGHGDVLGGVIIADEENFPAIRALSRTIGPTMSPFDSYLTMRGIKTMPLRVERQCANACKVASWLSEHPKVERVYFTGDPKHRRGHHRSAVPEKPARRHVGVRFEKRRQTGSLPLHGSAENDRARHLSGRRPHHGFVSRNGDPSRNLGENAPPVGHRRRADSHVHRD